MRDATADRDLRPEPQNLEIEQAFLGALLVANRLVESERVLAVQPEDFFQAVHGRIFATIVSLVGEGRAANPVTLKNKFDQDDTLAEVGGAQYLVRLAASVVTTINIEDYARSIIALANRRRRIGVLRDALESQYAFDADGDEDADFAEYVAKMSEIETRGQSAGPASLVELGQEVAVDIEAAWRGDKPAGIATGFIDLDRILSGLRPGQLIVIAARPSMGKTALAITGARQTARVLHRTAFFSYEMSPREIAERVIAGESGISPHALRDRKNPAPASDLYRFVEKAVTLDTLPLVIFDGIGGVMEVEREARRMKRAGGLALVFIDYLQLVRAPPRERASRTEDVGAIARDLKTMAKRLGVPVVALSQLNRGVEARDDKRPMLSDLRESGEIEQAADAVIFLYREEYYLKRSRPAQRPDESVERFNDRHEAWRAQDEAARGKAELNVAKNRNGPTDRVELRFDAGTMAFQNLADGDRIAWRRDE